MEVIVFVVLGLVGVALILAWSIGLGWLVSHLLPFTLFEGSLLSLVASALVGYLGSRLLTGPSFSLNEPMAEEGDWIDASTYDIPATRFYQLDAEKTWEAWFKFEGANRLYDELQQAPKVTGRMNPMQQQELAIRLMDIGVALLKTKTGRAKQIRTRLVDWQQSMTKQGLKPYDEPILRLAMSTLHRLVSSPPYERVVQNKLWDKPAVMFDLVDHASSDQSP